MAQLLRPVSTIDPGNWDTGATAPSIHQAVGTVTPDDSTYGRSGSGASNDTCILGLSQGTQPVAGTQTVRYRYSKDGSAGRAIELTVQLRQDTSLIGSQTHSNIGPDWVSGSFTVSGITAYTSLRCHFIATQSGSGAQRRGRVSWFEFDIPDAEPGTGEDLVTVIGEPVGTAENKQRPRGLGRLASDVVGLSGAVTRSRALTRLRGEAAAVLEAVVPVRTLARFGAEAVAIAEATVTVVGGIVEAVVRIVSDTMAMTETVSRPRRLARVRAELMGIAAAVLLIGGFVSAAAGIVGDRLRMRIAVARRLIVGVARRFNVPPSARQ